MKKIYFDMDGTVADLYGREGWHMALRTEQAGLFKNLEPLHDMDELKVICEELITNGWEIGIITWLPIGATKEYQEICTAEKIEWANRYMPYVTEIFAQVYGTPKHTAPERKAKIQVLVDDNDEVREIWKTPKQRKAIDAKDNMLEKLKELLDK